jgi:hypothetical protein
VVAIVAVALAVFVIGIAMLDRLSSSDGGETAETPPTTAAAVDPPAPFEVPPIPEGADAFEEPQTVTPEQWDPVVADLVTFVEEERRLRFEEPVTVELVSGAEIVSDFSIPDDPFFRDYVRALVGSYRALGILEGDVDIVSQIEQGNEIGLLGLYDPTADVIRVRNDVGGEAGRSPFQRAVLVHELTHALQDQHADLSDPRSELEALSMQRMMVEGDARRIERAYVESLPPEEQAQYEETIGAVENQGAEAGLLGVLGIEGTVVYEGGSQITRLVDVLDGSEAVDILLKYPPDRPAQLLRGSTLFLHGQEPWASDEPSATYPDIPPDAYAIDGASQGAWLWYVIFATRIDPADALRSADAIGSDRYVLYDQGGQICAAFELVAAGPDEVGHLARGVQMWAAGLPHGATVTIDGTVVSITVCDPGAGASAAFVNSPAEIVDGPIARVAAVSDVLGPQRGWWHADELGDGERWCLAETVQRAVSLEEAQVGLDEGHIAELGEWAVRSCLPDRVPSGSAAPTGVCSAAGLEPALDQEGLPEAATAARRRILEAATACDFTALGRILASAGPYFDDAASPAPDRPTSLARRWERREELGQPVLANLVATLDSGWMCGPAVATAVDGGEGAGCGWVWSGEGPVDRTAYVALVDGEGGWMGFGEDVDIQSELMALWSGTVTGTQPTEEYQWTAREAGAAWPLGWPTGVAPTAELRDD